MMIIKNKQKRFDKIGSFLFVLVMHLMVELSSERMEFKK